MDNVVTTNAQTQLGSVQQTAPAQVAQGVSMPNTQVIATPVVGIQPVQPAQQPVVNNQALFTQDQLNGIISGRINPLNDKIKDLTTQLAEANAKVSAYQAQFVEIENRKTASSAGVPEKFLDYAIFEANKLVSKDKSFDVAIKEYVAANGSLLGISQQDSQPSGNGSPANIAGTQGIANPQQAILNTQAVSQNIQMGNTSTVASGTSNMNDVNSVVDNFLKGKGIKR